PLDLANASGTVSGRPSGYRTELSAGAGHQYQRRPPTARPVEPSSASTRPTASTTMPIVHRTGMARMKPTIKRMTPRMIMMYSCTASLPGLADRCQEAPYGAEISSDVLEPRGLGGVARRS